MIAFAPVHTITQPYDLREKIRRSASFPSGFGPLWCAPSALAVEHPGALEKNARLFDVSHAKDDGPIGTFGDDVAMYGLSCDEYAGRHDHGEPIDAGEQDLLCLS